MKKFRKLLLATTMFLATTIALAVDEVFVYIGDGWALVCNITTNVCEIIIF